MPENARKVEEKTVKGLTKARKGYVFKQVEMAMKLQQVI